MAIAPNISPKLFLRQPFSSPVLGWLSCMSVPPSLPASSVDRSSQCRSEVQPFQQRHVPWQPISTETLELLSAGNGICLTGSISPSKAVIAKESCFVAFLLTFCD
ncbi:hypothetical protein K440DRAFT_391940 [Wilcoxina mikolae CBS 423.85]|nr:hypothetical protein K440DRAFT_391940 [Wilcoxina mikolae CBS 423.85]